MNGATIPELLARLEAGLDEQAARIASLEAENETLKTSGRGPAAIETGGEGAPTTTRRVLLAGANLRARELPRVRFRVQSGRGEGTR